MDGAEAGGGGDSMPSSIKLIGGSFDATDTTMLSSLSSHRGGGDEGYWEVALLRSIQQGTTEIF
jgi:hypothetical protein